MRYFIGAMSIIIATTLWIMWEEQKASERLMDFYYSSCVALPGQVSIMKWNNGKPMCERKEEIVKPKGNNLLSWRE
jgi:hypothetical protein